MKNHIDFPQAVDIRTNPNAETLLVRDRENVRKFFEKNYETKRFRKN